MSNWIGEFFYQIASVFLFAVALFFTGYFLTEKRQTEFLVSAFCTWVIAGAALFIFVNEKVLIEPETRGILFPARRPDPPGPSSCNPSDIPKQALKIFLGRSGLAYTTGDSFTFLEVAGKVLLAARRQGKELLVSARIYSRDDRIVAQIEDNRFVINPNNYFRRERPDKHSLVVFDQQDREVLNIEYLNPTTVMITGLFYYPRRKPVRIGMDQLDIMGNLFSDYCFGNTQTVIKID